MKSLNRIEVIIGGILVLIFIIWSYDTCSSSSKKYQPQEPPQQEQPDNQEPRAQEDAEQTTTTNSNTTAPAPTQQPVQAAPAQSAAFPVIYVKIDKLKMRDKPFLSGSTVLKELPKNAELYYLNNNTDYTDKITLDGVLYDEPWLEVQTKDGQSRGWVYGGGIRLYKLSN